jgi:hypothetical protein
MNDSAFSPFYNKNSQSHICTKTRFHKHLAVAKIGFLTPNQT